MSKLTRRSIWFATCVGIGLFLAYMDDIELLAIAKTGLYASLLFVAFLVSEHIYLRWRGKDDQ